MGYQTTDWTKHYFIRVQFADHEYLHSSMCDGQGAWWTARDKAAQYHVPVIVTYGTDSTEQEIVYRIAAR